MSDETEGTVVIVRWRWSAHGRGERPVASAWLLRLSAPAASSDPLAVLTRSARSARGGTSERATWDTTLFGLRDDELAGLGLTRLSGFAATPAFELSLDADALIGQALDG